MKFAGRIVLAMTLTLSLLFALPASAQTWKQWDRARVNSLRAAHNLRPLGYRYTLQREAQLWAEKMARTGYTRQNFNAGPCFAFATSTVYGDNVGQGPTVPSIEQTFERSPSHRANLLDRQFRWLGIGIAYGRGTIWMDQVFCG